MPVLFYLKLIFHLAPLKESDINICIFPSIVEQTVMVTFYSNFDKYFQVQQIDRVVEVVEETLKGEASFLAFHMFDSYLYS